jgi:hypothetical protein
VAGEGMNPKDKYGNPIYPHIFKKLLHNAKVLESLGFMESKNKPNLFYKKIDEGLLFADMRSSEVVPIWQDTRPLFYWKFNDGVPKWKARRIVKRELTELGQNGCESRLSFEAHSDPIFENVSSSISEESLVFDWPDGYCKLCGKDFQDDGNYCSEKCEKAHEETWKDHCAKCGKSLDFKSVLWHHISYVPEEKKIPLCRSCHLKVHKSKDSALKPAKRDTPNFCFMCNKKISRTNVSGLCRKCGGAEKLKKDKISKEMPKIAVQESETVDISFLKRRNMGLYNKVKSWEKSRDSKETLDLHYLKLRWGFTREDIDALKTYGVVDDDQKGNLSIKRLSH